MKAFYTLDALVIIMCIINIVIYCIKGDFMAALGWFAALGYKSLLIYAKLTP